MVTGGNAGIGFEVCKQLIVQGAHVLVVCRRNDETALQQLEAVQSSSARGGKATLVLCDVSSAQSVSDCVKHVSQSFARLDVLVLNAGVMLEKESQSVVCVVPKIFHTHTYHKLIHVFD
jgi:NAD(P)-dependent dehydrogenase (short-subunit alcohol dehydrogenase family)